LSTCLSVAAFGADLVEHAKSMATEQGLVEAVAWAERKLERLPAARGEALARWVQEKRASEALRVGSRVALQDFLNDYNAGPGVVAVRDALCSLDVGSAAKSGDEQALLAAAVADTQGANCPSVAATALGDRLWARISRQPVEADLRMMERLRGHPRHADAVVVLAAFVAEKHRLETEASKMRLTPLQAYVETLRFPENVAQGVALFAAASAREPSYAGMDAAIASGEPKAMIDAFVDGPSEDWRASVSEQLVEALQVYATTSGRTDAQLAAVLQEASRLSSALRDRIGDIRGSGMLIRQLDKAVASRSLGGVVDVYLQGVSASLLDGVTETRVVVAVTQMVGVSLGSEAGVASALAVMKRLPESVRAVVGESLGDGAFQSRLDSAIAARSVKGVLDVYELGALRPSWQSMVTSKVCDALSGTTASSLTSGAVWEGSLQRLQQLPQEVRVVLNQALTSALLARLDAVLAGGDVKAMVTAYERGLVLDGWTAQAEPRMVAGLRAVVDPFRMTAAGLTRALAEIERLPGVGLRDFRRDIAGLMEHWSPGVGLMRLIPAGTFTMGCVKGRDDVDRSDDYYDAQCEGHEYPAHRVTLSRGFYLMEHEVTQGQWAAVMGRNPSENTTCGPRCPVEMVSWHEAQTFIAKVSARDGVTYRLPTEAEWEYAARGGENHQYAGSADPWSVGWFEDNSGDTLHVVCSKARNGFGLCDMTGSVWEWTADWWGPYPSAAQTDPRGPSTGSDRVLRGGSWGDASYNIRISERERYVSVRRGYDLGYDDRGNSLGFRLAMDAP
jgi:formylglycine-generating enzyme required for sulfatase activity